MKINNFQVDQTDISAFKKPTTLWPRQGLLHLVQQLSRREQPAVILFSKLNKFLLGYFYPQKKRPEKKKLPFGVT